MIINDDCLKALDTLEQNSIDSIITDPPYGLTSITKRFGSADSKPAQYGKDGSFQRLSKGFMGKEWDGSGIEYNVDLWGKCLRVLKPGGHLLAFGGSRTFHRIACAIEDAGFEIRDTIMWLYGSGFPKSMNIGLMIDKKNGIEVETDYVPNMKNQVYGNGMGGGNVPAGHKSQDAQNEWNGWGTTLKPSFEPIIVARKPLDGTCLDNVQKWGVGGINIDECRVGNETIKGGTMPDFKDVGKKSKEAIGISRLSFGQVENAARIPLDEHVGRFPANTILTYDDTDFNEVCGGFPYTKNSKRSEKNNKDTEYTNTYTPPKAIYTDNNTYGDEGSACRYFYCAKASKKDRDEGCDSLQDGILRRMRPDKEDSNPTGLNKEGRFAPVVRKNTHPCVKPTELMQYLIRLVTPKGGTVLDPFMGSGSTGKAVAYENKERNAGYKFIGIEREKEYCDIAEARISYAERSTNEDNNSASMQEQEKQPTNDLELKDKQTYDCAEQIVLTI